MQIKVGCCGFPVFMDKYFGKFRVVELQQTFYHPPEISTVQRWRQTAPGDFEFTIKAWQLITHTPESPTYRRLKIKIPEKQKSHYGFFKPTDEVLSAWEKIDELAKILRAKVILFQCPASFKPTDENIKNMEKFFKKVERKNYIFCWEPRGKWDDEKILKICKKLDLVHVVDPFKNKPLYGKIKYLRLHGISGYRYNYSDDELMELNRKIKEFEKDEIYVMFNNTEMLKNAERFQNLIV